MQFENVTDEDGFLFLFCFVFLSVEACGNRWERWIGGRGFRHGRGFGPRGVNVGEIQRMTKLAGAAIRAQLRAAAGWHTCGGNRSGHRTRPGCAASRHGRLVDNEDGFFANNLSESLVSWGNPFSWRVTFSNCATIPLRLHLPLRDTHSTHSRISVLL